MTLTDCGVHFTSDRMIIEKAGAVREWELPSFPLSSGRAVPSKLLSVTEKPFSGNKVEAEACYSLTETDDRLIVRVRAGQESDIVRFTYELLGEEQFCGIDTKEHIFYGGITSESRRIYELQISEFDRILHSFVPSLRQYEAVCCSGFELIGPVILEEDAQGICLMAYEHGAQAPDHFLAWEKEEDRIILHSVKGNYFGGQNVGEYRSVWIEIGFADNKEKMFRKYREFLLKDLCVDGDSREPYIFFNSWHNQEGNTYFHGDSYLKYMNEEFTLQDIDRAHEIGVEVYVIDTGWFCKTGDWEVNEAFFPEQMKKIRERLDTYGMRLGLWFNPIAAAQTSEMFRKHPECVMNWQGEDTYWGKIWETEESYGMCLVSDYSDMFIEKLVQLNQTLGVSYFKWDAVGQYGCDSPLHRHGTKKNSSQERADAYAYRMGLEMIRIAQEVSRRCPGAIVDFDVTEGGRFVGLGFLSAGKYFLINNGPYFHNFDIPSTVKMEPDTINVFFYPGAARPQICRQAAKYDSYIPSVLFLTHFFPHGSELGQINSMAALVLGGNGIWGFLQQMSQEDLDRWSTFIRKYKRIRKDLTESYPIHLGEPGGSPEIHEKLNPATGCGVVVFFTHGAGEFAYVTQPLEQLPEEIDGSDDWAVLKGQRVRIRVNLKEDEAAVVFFMKRSREDGMQ